MRAKLDCDPVMATARSMADEDIPAAYRNAYRPVNSQSFISAYKEIYRCSGMSLAERLQQRMRKLGLSQAELARRVKVSQPTINALVSGETQHSRYIGKIALELETTTQWLQGETDDPTEGAIVLSDRDAIAEKLGLAMIPELSIGYSMGGGNFLTDYEQTGVRVFDRDWLRGVAKGAYQDLFVARGEGDSMEPTLRDGDAVLIDTSQKDIRQQDRIWAVSYGDLGMIKRVRRLPGGTYHLLSDNPAVTPVTAADDEMHVIGRVIWIARTI
ncbi:helix-turn-helix transcriptional regulator [Sphingomonadaceae bacterium G21617-S1]|nr:helix-turn-helix transcriptional regulator [Sphingomonadaceae bacterium G21617-S1]